MKPLPWIASGFLVVLLTATAGGWDLLPDPVGWLLVLLGTRALPDGVRPRGPLLGLGSIALLVSALTWPPAVAARLVDADPSLVWVAGLPQLGYVAVLAHALAAAARRTGDGRAAGWWSFVRTVTVVVALLPAVVIGGGVDGLEDVAGAVTVLAPLLVVVLLLAHAGRPWAQDPATTPAQTTTGPPPEGGGPAGR